MRGWMRSVRWTGVIKLQKGSGNAFERRSFGTDDDGELSKAFRQFMDDGTFTAALLDAHVFYPDPVMKSLLEHTSNVWDEGRHAPYPLSFFDFTGMQGWTGADNVPVLGALTVSDDEGLLSPRYVWFLERHESNNMEGFYVGFGDMQDAKRDSMKYDDLPFDNPEARISEAILNVIDAMYDKDVEVRKAGPGRSLGRKVRGSVYPKAGRSIIVIKPNTRLMATAKALRAGTGLSKHRHYVRGFFKELRSEHWKNKRGQRVWVHPHIRGSVGLPVKKEYVVKE